MARSARVVFQPRASRKLQQGIEQMVAPLRATLGPLARHVVCEVKTATTKPEIIESGGVIARRIIELPDPDADMGAMLVRHLVSRLHETVGDCTATAAVLFQAVFDEGLRFIEAGANPALLRAALDDLLPVILDCLDGMATPVEGKHQLAAIAESICHDAPMAALMGEIFDIIGEYGQLDVRVDHGRDLRREYVDGAYWVGGVFSRELLANGSGGRIDLVHTAVLLSDLEVTEPTELLPAIAAARSSGFKALVLVVLKISDTALGFLAVNREKFPVVAVRTPGGNLQRDAALQDMAALVGGRLFLKGAGDQLQNARPELLGYARRAWADREYIGLIGGGGNPRAFRQHIANLRAAHARADDPEVRKTLQERLGRLMGGSATLRVGGLSEIDAQTRKKAAERTAETLRGAVRTGVLPGGGAALLACQPAIEVRLRRAASYEEQAACQILLRALEAPARTIAANAGYEESTAVALARAAGPGFGFDVHSGRVVEMRSAGILDAAWAYQAAVRGALGSAAQALTIDVLVHHKEPERVLKPG